MIRQWLNEHYIDITNHANIMPCEMFGNFLLIDIYQHSLSHYETKYQKKNFVTFCIDD